MTIEIVEKCLYETVNRHLDSDEIKLKQQNLSIAINSFLHKMPKVFDPFAGGGAIPLEAARLGCRTFGNDINPVAHIIQRGSLEFPQKYGKPIVFTKDEFIKIYGENACDDTLGDFVHIDNRLAFDVEFYAKKLLKMAEEDIGHFYPEDENGKKPIAYYWARVATCANPACRAEVPLLKQFYLCNKPKKRVHLKPIINGTEISFEIKKGTISERGWMSRMLNCPCCGNSTEVAELKRQSVNGEIKQKCENMYWMPPNDTGYFAIYFNLIYEDSLLFHDSLIVHVFDEGQLTLDAIQKLTQINYGSIAKFSYSLYDSLLHELSKQKYIVIPLYEYMGNINTGKVTVGLRHDVDHEPFKGLHMAEMEASYGFRSSFYLLHSAEYFGHWFKGRLYRYSSMIPLYKQYQSLDCEIGVHNDLISIMLLYDVDPYEFMHDEMKFYDNNNINIYGTASHGSALMRMLKMNNQWIFSNFHSYDVVEYNGKTYEIGKYSLEDYGFEYEAYHVGYNIYFSDAGGSWNVDNFETVLDSLRSAQAGDRIVILTHPCWWK